MNNRTFQDYIPRLQGLQDRRRTPHKPFLLLIIIEMLESGELCENRIPFREIEKKKSFFADLIVVFNSGNPTRWRPSLHNPFFHLKTNGFWHLDPPELQSGPASGNPNRGLSSQHGCYCSARRASFCFLRNARVSGDTPSGADPYLFFKY